MHNIKLVQTLVLDFGGTLARTFDSCEGVLSVHGAVEKVIYDMLGKYALHIYRERGGLRNRAPTEIISELILLCELNPSLHDELTEEFVKRKVAILTDQISPEWPLPTPGCVGYLRHFSDVGLQLGIISTGHETFIRRCFEMWGLKMPMAIVSEDDMRGRKTLPLHDRVKPSPALFRVFLEKLPVDPGEVLYVGDDPEKDGQFAANSGLRFCLYDPSGQRRNSGVAISHWNELAKYVCPSQW